MKNWEKVLFEDRKAKKAKKPRGKAYHRGKALQEERDAREKIAEFWAEGGY